MKKNILPIALIAFSVFSLFPSFKVRESAWCMQARASSCVEDKKVPIERLLTRTDPQLDRILIRLYEQFDALTMKLQERPALTVEETQRIAKAVGGLLGGFGVPLAGTPNSSDPLLDNLSTGGVTSISVAAGSNLTGGGTVTTSGTINIAVTDNPLFTTVGIGDLHDLGITTSAADPDTSDLPTVGDRSIHINSVSKSVFLAFNYDGTVVKVLLS